MIDFLIVGNGLAGIFMSNILLNNSKSIHVVADESQNSTDIAAGLYNPVVLKRFTLAWKALEQSQILVQDYYELEKLLNCKILHQKEILRKLFSVEEQNNWTVASDYITLKSFLNSELIININSSINAPFNYGAVNQTGFVDVKLLKSKYQEFLKNQNIFFEQNFNYQDLIIEDKHFIYQNQKYQNVIFCEGFGLKNNFFFNYLPLDGTKGELLTIYSEHLKLDKIVNSSIFILPLGNHLYRVGATYHWKDKNNIPTEDAKQELITQLNQLINCEYQIINHFAGVRPTVNDRKPLLGKHPLIDKMFIMNGLGTRGVMLAPYLSKILFQNIENNIEISKEINIKRYQKLFI